MDGNTFELPITHFELIIDDPELLAFIASVPESQRQRYLLTALRIGLLTLHGAQGEIDRKVLLDMTEQIGLRLQDTLQQQETALRQLLDQWSGEQGHLQSRLDQHTLSLLAALDPNKEGSVLKQTIERVELYLNKLRAEWSLDDENSALNRVQRLLQKELQQHWDKLQQWQHSWQLQMEVANARKEEALRGTRHGEVFEHSLNQLLLQLCQSAGHICEPTGNKTGLIKNCKVGDAVITLGNDHFAAGARIVVEAKQRQSYDLKMALEELTTACKNRDATVGIFVFSSKRAPEGLKPFQRFGHHLVVKWDSEDPTSDIYLEAAFMVACALCKEKRYMAPGLPDFAPLQQALIDLEKEPEGLDDLHRMTTTIRNNSDKMLKKMELMRETAQAKLTDLNRGVELLTQMEFGIEMV